MPFLFPEIQIRYIKRHSSKLKHRVHTECLYRFHVPVSPHLAAQLAAGEESQKVDYSYFVPALGPDYFVDCLG
jgi:hypothetical protein